MKNTEKNGTGFAMNFLMEKDKTEKFKLAKRIGKENKKSAIVNLKN